MDFQTALVWLQGLGLGLLLIGLIGLGLKKAGIIDSVWGLLAKFVDWVIWVFNTLVVSAPGFVKVGLFLLMFSLVGTVIAPLTIGVYAVCDSQGDLWTTDDFFEGFSAQTLPGGLLSVVNGVSLRVDPVSSAEYMSPGGLPVASVDDEGVMSVDGSVSSNYAVCYSKSADECYVKRSNAGILFTPSDACLSVTEVESVTGDYVTLLYYYYDDVEYDVDAGSYVFGAEKQHVYAGSGLTNAGGEYYDLSVCKESENASLNITVVRPANGLYKLSFGALGRAPEELSGFVVGYESQLAAARSVLDEQKYSALRVKDSFISRAGSGFVRGVRDEDSAVTYTCEEGEKKVLVFGLDVFNPVFMFVLVVVGSLIALLIKMR